MRSKLMRLAKMSSKLGSLGNQTFIAMRVRIAFRKLHFSSKILSLKHHLMIKMDKFTKSKFFHNFINYQTFFALFLENNWPLMAIWGNKIVNHRISIVFSKDLRSKDQKTPSINLKQIDFRVRKLKILQKSQI